MIALYIILGIIALLAVFLSLRVRIIIRYDEWLTIRYGFGPWISTIAPVDEGYKERRKPRLSSFTARGYERHLKRSARREKRKAKKKEFKKKLWPVQKTLEDESKKVSNKLRDTLPERLSVIFEFLVYLVEEFPNLASHFRTNVREMKITVGAEDASDTAETYGKVCALSAAILDFLECNTRMKPTKDGAVSVNADFIADKSTTVVDIVFSISMFSRYLLYLRLIIWYLGVKTRSLIERENNK